MRQRHLAGSQVKSAINAYGAAAAKDSCEAEHAQPAMLAPLIESAFNFACLRR